MTLFDRYILREWLKILGLILCATVGLLMIQALYDNFSDLIEAGASLEDILIYHAIILPSYFPVVLPISLLLSLLFVLSKMHRNNEITAMRAAGLNIFAVTRSLWLASLAFCGVSLLLNARVAPWSVETSRSMLDGLQYHAEEKTTRSDSIGLVTRVAFDNPRTGRMWFINRFSRFTQTAYGVTVSELDPQRREHTRLMAREGHYDAARHAWAFTEGREMSFDPATGELIHSVPFAERVMPAFNEDPALMLLIDRDPRDLSLFELRRIVDYFRHESNPKVRRYAVRYHSVLADTFAPLIILAIAIPFSVTGVRVSPAVGVSKSIGLFFAYYLLSTIATSLGGNGYMDPFLAASLPNLTMVGVATYFFGRLR